MADLAYRNDIVLARGRTDWGAIWGGIFCFYAIWFVFGMLGVAVFSSIANPNAAHPITGMPWGEGAWIIVLTAVSFYVAGRETGHLAGVTNQRDGLIHGLVMFGLAVIGLVLLITIGGTALSGGNGVADTAHSNYVFNVVDYLGWAGFIALFLGWLGAMFGARQSAADTMARPPRTEVPENTRTIRPAA
jgi:hypothetical protein